MPSSFNKKKASQPMAPLPRKAGSTALVVHFDGVRLSEAEKLAAKARVNGEQTVGPMLYTNHQDETKIATRMVSNQSKDDKKLVRIVNLIPQVKVKPDEEKYEYKQQEDGRWSWRKANKRKLEELVY
jgi:hypothetical protein